MPQAEDQEKTKTHEFTRLGIYERGDVIVPGIPREAFLNDATWDFALIRRLPDTCDGELICGLKVYDGSRVDAEVMNICSLKTWEALYDNGFLDWDPDDMDGTPLEWAVKSPHRLDTAIFDFLYEKFPDSDIKSKLWLAPCLDAVKWLDQHGADRYYDGLRDPMPELVANRGYRDTPAIVEYLYGTSGQGPEMKEGQEGRESHDR